MATCQNCGAELSGPYCNTCGARAPEERASKKKAAARPAAKPAATGRGPGLFSPQRIGRTTVLFLIGIVCFAGGMVAGFWLGGGGGAGGSLTSTSVDATDAAAGDAAAATPIAQAGAYMDEGVNYMTNGDKTSAAASFRKAITAYQKVLKDNPDDLYAKSYLGLTYYYIGDSKNAVANEQAVLAKDPNYLWAVFNLAWMYQTGNLPDQAKQMYQKYLDVADQEKANSIKYAEQFELIDTQVQAAKDYLNGGTGTGNTGTSGTGTSGTGTGGTGK
jgi:hypothetical protein